MIPRQTGLMIKRYRVKTTEVIANKQKRFVPFCYKSQYSIQGKRYQKQTKVDWTFSLRMR